MGAQIRSYFITRLLVPSDLAFPHRVSFYRSMMETLFSPSGAAFRRVLRFSNWQVYLCPPIRPQVIFLDITNDQALKFVISLGAVQPNTPQKSAGHDKK